VFTFIYVQKPMRCEQTRCSCSTNRRTEGVLISKYSTFTILQHRSGNALSTHRDLQYMTCCCCTNSHREREVLRYRYSPSPPLSPGRVPPVSNDVSFNGSFSLTRLTFFSVRVFACLLACSLVSQISHLLMVVHGHIPTIPLLFQHSFRTHSCCL
jgi:hypothetical protein